MPVTREDTVAAYRMLLGREATERETEMWLHVPTVADLRQMFISSTEFQAALAQASAQGRPQPDRLACDLPAISVEWETDSDAQRRLIEHVTETWTTLGREEPHWSVLSNDAFKSRNFERNADWFYESGARDTNLVTAILERYGLSPADLRRAVEYGCGVGRVTPHLAAVFSDLVGIDISESHLSFAGKAIAKNGCNNVHLVLARAPDFGMVAPFDVWFSNIVLQHNPPPIIALILRRMFSLLDPGGVAIFQVTTYAPGYRFNVAEYLGAPKAGAIEIHCLPQRVIFELAHGAGCVPLDVREDSAMGYPWLSNLFVFRKQTWHSAETFCPAARSARNAC
jgi:SAM-dependent methyltransferase